MPAAIVTHRMRGVIAECHERPRAVPEAHGLEARLDQPLRLFRGALILRAAAAPESNLAVRPDNAPIRRNLLHPRLAGADMGEWHRLAQRFLRGSGGAFHGLLKKLQI